MILKGNVSFFFHGSIPTIKTIKDTMKASSQSMDDYQNLNNSSSYEDANDEKEMEEIVINNELSSTTNLNPPR